MDCVYLTIAYCPSAFSGEGAVVRLSTETGAFNITRRFTLPGADASLGCPMNTDITYLADPHARPQRLLLLPRSYLLSDRVEPERPPRRLKRIATGGCMRPL